MTDSHSPSHQPTPTPTPQSTNAAHHAYDGFDPEFPEEKHEADAKAARVSTVQVGASAAAAVTSALAASFFGVAGTLIGAAVGSIVSTVAGALYADYLRKAGNRLRDTKTVVVQRLPAEVLTTTPLRHLTSPVTAALHAPHSTRPVTDPAGPAAVPSRASLQPVTQDGEETVAVPLATPEEIQQASTSFDPYTVISGEQSMHETQLIPKITAETLTQPAVGRPTVTPSGPGAGSGGDPVPTPVTDDRPWWKRPVVMLSGIGVLGFLVAVAFVTVIELGILHHPISGGGSGTSLSRVVDHKATTKPTPTATVTVTPSASATEPSASATATPTATATEAPTATPTATPTSTSGGTSTGQPTSTTQATSTAGDIAPVATSTP